MLDQLGVDSGRLSGLSTYGEYYGIEIGIGMHVRLVVSFGTNGLALTSCTKLEQVSGLKAFEASRTALIAPLSFPRWLASKCSIHQLQLRLTQQDEDHEAYA